RRRRGSRVERGGGRGDLERGGGRGDVERGGGRGARVERGGGRGDLERGGGRGAHEAKEAKEMMEMKEMKEVKEAKEAKEVKEVKEVKEAKEAGPSEVQAGGEVESMEVSGQPETPGETRGEPAPQAVPPPADEKAETWGGRGGATAKEEEDEEDSENDLYRGEDEIHRARSKKGRGDSVTVRDRAAGAKGSCSVEAEVNLLSYSEREWRGNTAKSALIRKGYREAAQSFTGLRRVRGDNYCALRATLFQVLAQSTELPAWLTEEDVTLWPEQLLAEKELIGQWRFPRERGEERAPEGAIEQLKHYMRLLRTRWEAAARAGSAERRQDVCAEVFRAEEEEEEEEYALLEALKFLMLRTACQLHARMLQGADVPVFCWLLFARDSSPCPRLFLTNHLRHVGVSGGLEQVEMFLLGYALQQTIKVYRLYKADTEEFVTYYPDDHTKDWPCVCLLTEDDRHYNVPVSESEELQGTRL
ncbi:hypothetical protein ANANG_G00171370, partial [Anguilla anguilla]